MKGATTVMCHIYDEHLHAAIRESASKAGFGCTYVSDMELLFLEDEGGEKHKVLIYEYRKTDFKDTFIDDYLERFGNSDKKIVVVYRILDERAASSIGEGLENVVHLPRARFMSIMDSFFANQFSLPQGEIKASDIERLSRYLPTQPKQQQSNSSNKESQKAE